jgi:hypothetical protein
MTTDETPRQILERMGAAKVRRLIGYGGLATSLMAEASTWLAHLDDEERARSEASQAEHIDIARPAKNAAWAAATAAERAAAAAERAATAAEKANIRATIALAIAAISVAIAIIPRFFR